MANRANMERTRITMTKVYFVRHAQPEFQHEDDRTRPLTEEGKADAKIVLDFLRDKEIDVFYCSPYKRSMDTIAETAEYFGKEILTDERLREREKGDEGNNHGMFRLRWEDHNYHEEGGESIAMVQERNIAALQRILQENDGKNIVIGTHGTALSSILNYYDNSFGCEDFLRIIDWMPYVIELDFEGTQLLAKTEHVHIEKEFKGNAGADKVKLQTERLVLEPLGTKYLQTTHEYSSDIENTRLMMFLPNETVEETLQFLTDVEQEWKKEAPSFYEFAILLEGVHIGAIGLYLEEDRKTAEFGWIINKNYWGQGYTKEAAEALLEYASSKWGVKHFFAHCDSENVASYSVMEGIGMKLTGRQGGRKNRASDEPRVELTYEITMGN